MLAGLAAAHGAMLVHRDIKPANLLRAGDGTWKVADFGIAKPLDSTADLTMTGVTIGTPSYLSPEQLEGRAATPASDVWAVAVVLYEALAGRKPFAGDTPFAIAHAVRSVEPQPIAAVRPDIDPALAAAITAAMAKDPDRRPRDASAMAAMLYARRGGRLGCGPVATATATASTASTAMLPPLAPPPRRDSEALRRRRLIGWIAAAVLVVAALVVGLVAGGVLSNDRSPSQPSTTTAPTTTAPTTAPTTRWLDHDGRTDLHDVDVDHRTDDDQRVDDQRIDHEPVNDHHQADQHNDDHHHHDHGAHVQVTSPGRPPSPEVLGTCVGSCTENSAQKFWGTNGVTRSSRDATSGSRSAARP